MALKAMTLPPRGMKIAAAASYAGIGKSSIYALINSGVIKPYKYPGIGSKMIDRLDLDRLIDSLKETGLTLEEFVDEAQKKAAQGDMEEGGRLLDQLYGEARVNGNR